MIMQELWASGVELVAITPVGSIRRYTADVGDVSLLATVDARHFNDVAVACERLPSVRRVASRSATATTMTTEHGSVTLRFAEPAMAGAALVCLTGSSEHVARLAARAFRRQLSLTSGRLLDAYGVPIPCETEEDLYHRIDLPFIPPELRDAGDEIDAAMEGRLPSLITDLHIRGDLHMHSTWSDGRDSIGRMVSASRALGYEYIAITDHSQRSMASRNLMLEDVDRQRAEIEDARRQHPTIQVLHGVEVDILKDGSLDFDDRVLAGFDIVLASLHDRAGHSAERLTERYLRAIESPLVDIITHPANRSPDDLQGYDVDFDRLFEAAARTGTAFEIDGAPAHLDMDGFLARRAAAAGVTVVVDSDSHRADALGRQMRFGVATARRGWLEPRHVLNTRGVDQIRSFVARQRARL